MTIASLPETSFLNDVRAYTIENATDIVTAIGAPIESLVQRSLDSGTAELSTVDEETFPDSSAAIAIPIYRSSHIVSVVVLSAKQLSDDHDRLVGVFEIWEPQGSHEELGLKAGYFGKMERFGNVSSFVRFEKGSGLPGQVWQQCSGVIHDELANHPGFLRAAGASADLLVTGIGIPIASETYHGSVLLLSSGVSPIARGMEVWQVHEDSFSLLGGAYPGLGNRIALSAETSLSLDEGLPGMARQMGSACLCDQVETVLSGRGRDAALPESISGLAIPFFDGETLTSVTTLLF